MKKLQNNFTTPEQSKRLLEVGVPADSADCVLFAPTPNSMYEKEILLHEGAYSQIINHYKEVGSTLSYLPCWSVGRLREIFCICSSVNGTREYPFCNDQVAWWITEFEFKKEFIDFSKLEE